MKSRCARAFLPLLLELLGAGELAANKLEALVVVEKLGKTVALPAASVDAIGDRVDVNLQM